MPFLKITKSYSNNNALSEIDIDNIRDAMVTFTNSTKLNSSNIQDDSVTLAKMADGTTADLLTWDGSNEIDTVTVGTVNELLTKKTTTGYDYYPLGYEDDSGDVAVVAVGSVGNNSAGHILEDESFMQDIQYGYWNVGADLAQDGPNLGVLNSYVGSTTFGETNILGSATSALDFDGSSGFMNSSVAGTGAHRATEHTIGGWFKSDDWASTTNQTLIRIGGHIGFPGEGHLAVRVNNFKVTMTYVEASISTETTAPLVLNPTTVASTAWLHVVVVYTPKTYKYELYVNGNVVATIDNSGGGLGGYVDETYFGMNLTAGGGNTEFLYGAGEEFFIHYRKAFSRGEILRIYANKQTNSHSTGTVLKAAVCVDDTGNTISAQSSSNQIIEVTDTDIYQIGTRLSGAWGVSDTFSTVRHLIKSNGVS